jgi:GWxTD domain-containing protein
MTYPERRNITMSKIRVFVSVGLIIFLTLVSSAQRRPTTPERQQFLYIETVNLVSENPDLGRLDINFRISKNFFVFTRATDQAAPYEFSGRGEMIVELFDREGRSVAREITERIIYSATHQQDYRDTEYLEDIFSFDVPSGEYRLYVQIIDLQSARRYTDRDRRVQVRTFPPDKLTVSDIVFLEPLTSERPVSRFTPLNLGGNVFFGRNFDAYIEFISSADPSRTPLVITNLYRIPKEKDNRELLFSDTLRSENFHTGKKLSITSASEKYYYSLTDSGRTDRRIAFLNVLGEQLFEGAYRLEISIDDGLEQQNKVHTFRVQWLDKPVSLRNLDFAVSILEYILSEEEYKEIRRGNDREKEEKFHAFWRSKDPDTTTAFNPVMAEFYRRVDYAAREFGTHRESNGAKTDRGRVYIIYGSPSNTQRLLSAGQPPQEIWIYTHLHQKFIFVDQGRQGNYRLVSREDI